MRILLIGKAGSGKSTLSEYIKEKYNFTRYSLGDNVKYFISDMTKILNEINPTIPLIKTELLFDVDAKKDYRQYMQKIGTELCQGWFGKTIWCELLDKTINYNSNIIIDDCRFIHEYEYFKNKGFITIKILRNNCLLSSHSSEIEQEKLVPDYIINNNESINNLQKEFDKIIENLI